MEQEVISPEEGFENFTSPVLGQLRASKLQDWADQFGDETLGDGILSNPRLERRVLKSLLPPLPSEDLDDKPEAKVLSLLMSDKREYFELFLGMAWCHASVLEWVTWNMLSQKLPGLSLKEARIAVTAVPSKTRESAGAPRVPDADLDEVQLRVSGNDLVHCWANGVSEELKGRLDMFLPIRAAKPHPAKSAMVHKVAETTLELLES